MLQNPILPPSNRGLSTHQDLSLWPSLPLCVGLPWTLPHSAPTMSQGSRGSTASHLFLDVKPFQVPEDLLEHFLCILYSWEQTISVLHGLIFSVLFQLSWDYPYDTPRVSSRKREGNWEEDLSPLPNMHTSHRPSDMNPLGTLYRSAVNDLPLGWGAAVFAWEEQVKEAREETCGLWYFSVHLSNW